MLLTEVPKFAQKIFLQIYLYYNKIVWYQNVTKYVDWRKHTTIILYPNYIYFYLFLPKLINLYKPQSMIVKVNIILNKIIYSLNQKMKTILHIHQMYENAIFKPVIRCLPMHCNKYISMI